MNTGHANKSSLIRTLTGLQNPESAEDTLLESDRKLPSLFDKIGFAVALSKPPDGVLVDVNEAWVNTFGYTRQEAIGKTTLELNINPGAEGRRRFLTQLQEIGSAHNIETVLRTKSGEWRNFLTNVDIVEIGGQQYILNTVEDITERKRAKEQLEQSNQKLNEILESIQDDFYVLDHDWKFVYASRSCTSKVGKESKDFVGNNIWQMFPKHLGTVLEENFRAAMEKREVRRFEIRGKYTDAWYRITAFPSAEGITVLGTDITESKRAEKQLAYLASFPERNPNPLIEVDFDGHVRYANPTALSLLPDLREQGPAHPWLAGLDKVMSMLREGETNIVSRDVAMGESVYQQSFFLLSEEHLIRTYGIDITRRKRAEEQLRELSQRLTYHVDHSPLAVIEWGPDMRLTRWSDAAERMFGWKAEEVLGKRMEDFRWIYDEDTEQVSDVSIDLRTGTNPRRFSANRNYRKDGSVVYCEWYNSSLLDESGNLRSILSLVLDVTDRTRAEQELAESEERYRNLVKYAPAGIYEIDLKTMRFIEVNDSMCQILGYTREELLSMMPDELLDEEGRRRFRERMQKTLAGEKVSHQTEYIVKAKDGHEIWGIFNSTINYDNEKPRSVSVIAHDITERKRAEEALRKNEEQLQLLNETLEQKVQEKTEEVRYLASNLVKAVQRERQRLSHILHDDLQQRVYVIQMQLSFLRDGLPKENEAAQKEVSDIEKQLAEIRKITRNLSIDLSPPILHDEGLSQAINWLAAQVRQQYGLSVELQANGPFAISDEELHIFLFNCVRELLFNVVKHAGASQAVVALQRLDATLRIEVRDDGKGFPVNMPKQQGSEEDSLHPGLGLSTMRHQLSLFGGHMEIKSEPGAGTQIVLIAPVAEGE